MLSQIFFFAFLVTLLTMQCSILCSEFAVKAIDQPFIGPEDDKDEWAL